MAQARDATSFNPPSPHSSSVGADSYNHEGTPDTRLTTFSPDENSARSNRALTKLDYHGSSGHPVHFHIKPVDGFSNVPAATEKDPFISSTATPKGEQKLSPTASAFRPVSVPLVARGSLPVANPALAANRQLFAPQVTANFSNELGISRCLALYAATHPVLASDVEEYLQVNPLWVFPRANRLSCTNEQYRSWCNLVYRSRVNATLLRRKEKCTCAFPTFGKPAMPMTVRSLGPPIGVRSTSLRLSSIRSGTCSPKPSISSLTSHRSVIRRLSLSPFRKARYRSRLSARASTSALLMSKLWCTRSWRRKARCLRFRDSLR